MRARGRQKQGQGFWYECVAGQRVPPLTVMASGGRRGRSVVRRTVNEFDLRRWSTILFEILTKQIKGKRARTGHILEVPFEFETWNKHP